MGNLKNYKNFGFTLIELLAVIIILAMVAFIAIPIILDVVDEAKILAGKSEANMILSGINNYCATEEVKEELDESYAKKCTIGMIVDTVKEMVNLGNATIENIKYNGNRLTKLEITSNNHKFRLCLSGTFAMDDEECEVIQTGPIGDVVLSKFSYLETNEYGCETSNVNNYSYIGGCYIKGNPSNNYIWFSGFLWRIMGINADGTIRLITEESVTAIPYIARNSELNWDESSAKDWLNNYFYPKLKEKDIITEQTWCSEITTDKNSARTTCTTNLLKEKFKVGLLTLDEYNLSGGSVSYLNIGQVDWMLTPYNNTSIWSANFTGDTYKATASLANGLRAIINISPDAIISSGNGYISTLWEDNVGPYILNDYDDEELVNNLNQVASIGEYVQFANKKYRVVETNEKGTKLILDGFYEEPEGTIYNIKYTTNVAFDINLEGSIANKLNQDVLSWLTNNNKIEKDKILTNIWYQNNFLSGDNYKNSIKENDNPISAKVGLINIGEILASQSSSLITKGYTKSSNHSNSYGYWLMNRNVSNIWFIGNNGSASIYSYSPNMTLRPVIVIKPEVVSINGNGTWSNPYKI